MDFVVVCDGVFFGGGGLLWYLFVYWLFVGEKGDEGVDFVCSCIFFVVRVSVDFFYKIKDIKNLNYDVYNIFRYWKYFMLINF